MTESHQANISTQKFAPDESTFSVTSLGRSIHEQKVDHLMDDRTIIFKKNFSKKPIELSDLVRGNVIKTH